MHAESERVARAKAAYGAYETRDRDLIESLIATEFRFHSPPDPELDRVGYFERCWPNARALERFEFVRVVENGEEVIVTYESTKSDGSRFRNTEVMRFEGERIAEVEVYFGWDLPAPG
jgi:hypothetical protein